MFIPPCSSMTVSILITLAVVGCVGGLPATLEDLIKKLAPITAELLGLPKPIPEIVEEAFLEATELIKRLGYPAENHTLTTDDGYILTNHRIPYGKGGRMNESAIPVLMVHGMNCESTQWFDNGPESLAFVLADEGYDVWVANVRGTSYSSHTKFSHNDDKFWDFQILDIVQKDISPLIDYILDKTKFPKLFYIGQSLGTALSFILLSKNPEYNEKIAGNIALAPAMQLKYTTMLFRPILQYHKEIRFLSNFLSIHNWLSVNPLTKELQMFYCPSENPVICEAPLNLMGGYDPYLRNRTRIPIYANHCSSGSSLNLIIFMGQLIFGDKLREFDYGIEENLRRYNATIPPELNTSLITAPTVLVYGANDIMTTPLDVEFVRRALPNVFDTHLVSHPMVTHTDFMFAQHGRAFLYDKIVNYLKQLW